MNVILLYDLVKFSFTLTKASHSLSGRPDQVHLSSLSDEHIHYQVDLTGMAEKVCPSGLPDG
jgi:hypothetical protein